MELGLRYTDYEKFRAADVTFGGFPYLPDIPGIPPNLQDFVKEQITGPTTAAFPIEGVPEEFQNIDDDAVTGSLTLRWDWTDDISLYANYGRAYRTKGNSIVPSSNVQFIPDPAEYLLHDEETSDSFELGMKGRFWGGRASLNAALYYQQYDGYLGFVRGVEVLDDMGNPALLPGGLIFNGDANITGIEFDGQVLLGETWSMGYGLAWTQAEWDGATEPCNDREPGELIGECDLDGEKVGGEPEWSGYLNSEYYFPLDSTEIYVRGLYKYTGERDNISASSGLGNVADEFDDFHIVDLFVGWRSSDVTWDVNVFAKNLFDADEVILQDGSDTYDQFFSGGSYNETNVLRERIIGMMARYNF